MTPPEPPWRPEFRTQFLVDTLGGESHLAEALGVEPGDPRRWQDGTENPSPEVARLVVDLDHVVARAVQLWSPEVALTWLRSSNPYLGGATPGDVLRSRGSSEVLEALDAALSGAYA